MNGRKIDYKYVDDAYEPSQTVLATRQLVQQDNVFAIFNTVGTENNLAVRSFLNQAKVPQLFVGTGVSKIGREHAQYPWTIGYLPSFVAEGRIYGRYIVKTKPKAKIAVLYENSDYGTDLTAGLRKGLGKKAARIVATQAYDPTDATIDSQMARLKASGANTFMMFATPKFAILAFIAVNKLGWRPQIFVSAVSISPNIMDIARASTQGRTTEGALSIAFVKDPTDRARYGRDPVMKLYSSILKQYLPSGKYEDVYNYYGMAVAYTMVDALRKAGRNLTRESLLRAATHLNERNPFMLDRHPHPDLALRLLPDRPGPLRPLPQDALDSLRAARGRARLVFLKPRPLSGVSSNCCFTPEAHERTGVMHRALRLAVLTGASTLAFAFAGSAFAAYAPQFIVSHTPSNVSAASTTITIKQTRDDDATAKVTFYVPQGLLGRARPGSRDEARDGRRTRAGNRDLAGRDPADQRRRDRRVERGRRGCGCFNAVHRHGHALGLLGPRSRGLGPEALGPGVHRHDRRPRSRLRAVQAAGLPAAPAAATFGAKLLDAALTLSNVFTAPVSPGQYVWPAFFTPYASAAGPIKPAGTVQSRAIVRLPGQVTLKGKITSKKKRTVTFTGSVTENSDGRRRREGSAPDPHHRSASPRRPRRTARTCSR